METRERIYIVDDDQHVVNSLTMMIESVGYQVSSFPNPKAFLEAYDSSQPCCLISDIRMPLMSGFELQQTLAERNINIPVIFLSGHGDIPMAVDAIKSGAVEFLTKPVDHQRLLDAINQAIRYSTKQFEDQQQMHSVHERVKRLTPRENEIMGWIVRGKQTKEIAKILDISPNTVEQHRTRIMKKMEVKTLAELVGMIIASGIVKLEPESVV